MALHQPYFCHTSAVVEICELILNLNTWKNMCLCPIRYFHQKTPSTSTANDDQIKSAIIEDSVAYGILLSVTTLIQLIAGIFAVDGFNQTALRQITRFRIKYFQSLMRQEIGWYDVAGGNNNFAVRATE